MEAILISMHTDMFLYTHTHTHAHTFFKLHIDDRYFVIRKWIHFWSLWCSITGYQNQTWASTAKLNIVLPFLSLSPLIVKEFWYGFSCRYFGPFTLDSFNMKKLISFFLSHIAKLKTEKPSWITKPTFLLL